MNFSPLNLFMLFGALQGFVIVGVLFSKSRVKTYLGLVVLSISMNFLYYGLLGANAMSAYPKLAFLFLPWGLIGPVAYYAYIKTSAQNDREQQAFLWPYFLPFFVFAAINLIIQSWCSVNGIANSKEVFGFNLYYNIVEYITITVSFASGYLSLKFLEKKEQNLQETIANYDERQIEFQKQMSIIVIAFVIVWFFSYSYSILVTDSPFKFYYGLGFFSVAAIYWVVYKRYTKQKSVPSELEVSTASNLKENLYDTEHEVYKRMLLVMEEEQVFKNTSLSLAVLAEKLNVSNSHLSAVINQATGKNFYHFINDYRVNHFINLLKDGKAEHFTLLSLAIESGFNSKSTFYSAFKRFTGMTPTKFLNSL